MDKQEIQNKIQAENDSYNRHLKRLQQKTLDLKTRHQRIITDLQKLLAKQQNINENIIKTVNAELEKFL